MPENENRALRPFAEVLLEMRRGTLHDELTERLATVVEGVQTTGKAGKLSLTLTIKPGPARGSIVIADDLKDTTPQDKDTQLFFARDGYVSLRHPDQPPLFDDDERPARPRAIPPADTKDSTETGATSTPR